MFRVIHPNRWFFWTIAAILIVGLVVIYYLQQTVEELNEHSTAISTGSAMFWSDPQYPGWHSFRPEGFGLSLKYPPLWQVEIDRLDANVVTLENPKNFDENISITMTKPTSEKLIRQSLKIDSESPITVDGEKGTWIRGADAKDKATANVILVQHNSKLYYIAGSALQFEKIVGSIHFFPEQGASRVEGWKTYRNEYFFLSDFGEGRVRLRTFKA